FGIEIELVADNGVFWIYDFYVGKKLIFFTFCEISTRTTCQNTCSVADGTASSVVGLLFYSVKVKCIGLKGGFWFGQNHIATGKGKLSVPVVFGVFAFHGNGVALCYPHISICFYKVVFQINKGLVAPHFHAFVNNVNLSGFVFGVNCCIGKFWA